MSPLRIPTRKFMASNQGKVTAIFILSIRWDQWYRCSGRSLVGFTFRKPKQYLWQLLGPSRPVVTKLKAASGLCSGPVAIWSSSNHRTGPGRGPVWGVAPSVYSQLQVMDVDWTKGKEDGGAEPLHVVSLGLALHPAAPVAPPWAAPLGSSVNHSQLHFPSSKLCTTAICVNMPGTQRENTPEGTLFYNHKDSAFVTFVAGTETQKRQPGVQSDFRATKNKMEKSKSIISSRPCDGKVERTHRYEACSQQLTWLPLPCSQVFHIYHLHYISICQTNPWNDNEYPQEWRKCFYMAISLSLTFAPITQKQSTNILSFRLPVITRLLRQSLTPTAARYCYAHETLWHFLPLRHEKNADFYKRLLDFNLYSTSVWNLIVLQWAPILSAQ